MSLDRLLDKVVCAMALKQSKKHPPENKKVWCELHLKMVKIEEECGSCRFNETLESEEDEIEDQEDDE